MEFSPIEYTAELIYLFAGKDDKTIYLTFKPGTSSFKDYGEHLTAVFIYTQTEREKMDEKVKIQPFTMSGYVKAKYLGNGLSKEKILQLKNIGINLGDISEMECYNAPTTNTFHSKENRSIKTIEIPMAIQPKGLDHDWIYGFSDKLVREGIGLCPQERDLYLAYKHYYDFEKLTNDDLAEIKTGEGQMREEVERELLQIKSDREEISIEEEKQLWKLLQKNKEKCLDILDDTLKKAGSSIKKLMNENPEQAAKIYSRILFFKERRLNVLGKFPIYISMKSYLHIYMRHVKEMRVNNHFEHKDNFQWNEEDVFMVMGKIINEINNELQEFFDHKPGQRYSRYGKENIYFEGDYYTFHIESNGEISTFHKNRKNHEQDPT